MGSLLSSRLCLALLALIACDRGPKRADPARDLSRALVATSAEPTDTAARRRQAELERCKFVYHDEQGLRECLVLKNAWEPQDAARAIAIYEAEIARAVDSLQRIRDSLEAAEIEKQREQAAAAREKQRRQAAYAATQPYWGLTSSKTYYTNTPNCDPLAAIYNLTGVRFFKTTSEAERAGYTRAEEAGC